MEKKDPMTNLIDRLTLFRRTSPGGPEEGRVYAVFVSLFAGVSPPGGWECGGARPDFRLHLSDPPRPTTKFRSEMILVSRMRISTSLLMA